MKFKIIIAGILLVSLIATVVCAMEPGPTIIRECPKCKEPQKEFTMLSGNTFGATILTDGRMDAPMLPDKHWLVKCKKCGVLYWLDESKEIASIYPWDKRDDYKMLLGL